MVTLADSLVSSASRPLSLRVRQDLTVRRHRYHGQNFWVVKEPVGLQYFRFHDEEYAILQMLDGHTSLEQIKERFERQFTPQKITLPDLQQFVGMLHRGGLVVADSTGQGRQLRKRRDEKKRKELLGKFTNIFALRFRGFDPEWLLNRMYPYTAWFFSPVVVMLCLLLGFSALGLIVIQFDVFRSRLPTFHEFFGAHNWIWLAVTMGVVKVMHEFGHGLSCKHFKGECHEIGVMFLVFTPCLYCNVSDSWLLPNKYHRAFIGAAGMYVELVCASIATFIWWFSEPGLLNHIALSVMFICSVSTVMFNGNPLLRFDGYYILMDLIEIPNLRQKATEVLKRFMCQVCLGLEQPDNPFLPQRRRFFFGLYTVAAVIYRWVVVLSIFMFLNKVLEPYGLKVLGQMVAVAGLFGLVVQPLWKMWKFFYTPGRMHKVKRHRLAATLAVVGAALAGVMMIPLPFTVKCVLEVAPRDAESVYSDVPGQLREVLVKPGQQVTAGQPLARIQNVDLELQVAGLQGRQAETQVQLASLRQQRFQDPQAIAQIPEAEEILATINKQLHEKTTQLERLNIKAPVTGTVMPPPIRPSQPGDDGRLPAWSGSPLDPKNRGARLMESDLICKVGNPHLWEAVLVVDQSDIELVQLGHAVNLKLDAYPTRTFSSTIEAIADAELKATPGGLSSQAGGHLDTRTDASGVARPLSTSYQARVPLDVDDEVLRMGLRGRAKVYTGWQPLGRRLYRYLARTFHFHM